MNYAKALAVGVATGLLAVVLEFVVGIVSMMVQTAAQAGDGGGGFRREQVVAHWYVRP